MKKMLIAMTTLSVLGLSGLAHSAQSQHPCDYPIMHAQTKETGEEVRLCVSGDNLAYTFGKVNNKKPDIDILIPKSNSEFYRYEHGEEATLVNQPYQYTISNLTDETGHPIKELVVHKDGDMFTTVKLNKFEYSHITQGRLDEFDIRIATN